MYDIQDRKWWTSGTGSEDVRVGVEIDGGTGTIGSRVRKLRKYMLDETGCKVSFWK